MAPPDQIARQNAARGICLPDGSSEEVLASYAPAAVQQVQPSALASEVEGISDESKGISYARPVEVSRQPTHVFHANPVLSRQQRTTIALGDALQFWINQQEAQGTPVDSHLYELAEILHSGRLPDIHDEAFQILINQSLSDPALDAILHSVALETDVGPNRALYAQALRYSLNYYLHQDPAANADSGVRRNLIVALAHSTHSDSREILAFSANNAHPETRTQIQLALTHAAQAGRVILSSGGENIPGSHPLAIAPFASANQSAERLSFRSLVAALPQAANQVFHWASAHSAEIFIGSAALPGTAVFTLPLVAARLLAPVQQLLVNTYQAYAHDDLSSGGQSFTARSAMTNENAFESLPGATNDSAINANPLIPDHASENIALFDFAPSQWQGDSTLPALRHLGFPRFVSQQILDTLPSPFLMGCISLQGGVQQALVNANAQAAATYVLPQTYGPSFRVNPISNSGAGSWEQEGFGEGSSSEGNAQDQGGQGSQQEGQGHDESPTLEPADIYLNHRL